MSETYLEAHCWLCGEKASECFPTGTAGSWVWLCKEHAEERFQNVEKQLKSGARYYDHTPRMPSEKEREAHHELYS